MALRRSGWVQFTLAELTVLILFAGVGAAALKAGGAVASVLTFAAMALCMAFAVIALVARGGGQAFALGFLAPVALYATALFAIGASEFYPQTGRLPTSAALRPLYGVVRSDVQALSPAPVISGYGQSPYTQMFLSPSQGGYTYDPYAGGSPYLFVNNTTFVPVSQPDEATFMAAGHVLAGLLFGYVGGKFAAFLFRRRTNGAPEKPESPPPAS